MKPRKMVRWSYLQSRNSGTGLDYKDVDNKGESKVEWIEQLGLTCIYFHCALCSVGLTLCDPMDYSLPGCYGELNT